jgi:hypothetical protein
MRRKVALTAVIAVALAVSGYAQKPDFSGTWTLDQEASGMTGGGGGRGFGMGPMTVKQSADSITVESQGRQGPVTRTYKLDGTETDIQMGQMTAKASAKLDGNKLVITTKSDMGEQTQTWSVENNVLTIESTGGRGPAKRVYKKTT